MITGESILRALIEKRFIKSVFKYIDKALAIITLRIMERKIPVVDNKIIFLTFRGSYDCNPKWICQEIIRRDLPYQLFWTYKKPLTGMEDYPAQIKLVRQGSLEFYRALCSARIIIDNAILMSVLRYKKKKTQCLINTWHGSIGIKKIAKDAINDRRWVKKALNEGRQTDYLIANSTFEENIFRESYWRNTTLWKFGHPRNDILFDFNSDRIKAIREKVYRAYDIQEDVRICLYAPTFRDTEAIGPYAIDYKALTQALSMRFGGEWVVFTRFHFRVIEKLKKNKLIKSAMADEQNLEGKDADLPIKFVDANLYPDIQELMVCSDAAITDYSSWICEYMLTRRPGFLFVTDVSSYIAHDRAFYFPLDTLPFPIAESNEQLIQNILDFNDGEYKNRCDEFLQRHGSTDDGHAAGRVVDEIEKIMGG